MKVTAVILKFEQRGQEEYRTVPYIKQFEGNTNLYEIVEWVKSIDSTKSLIDVYFNDKV